MDFKDPALQPGPFPAWPTLPSTPQPAPHYLENDPTAWQGGDFPNHVTPLGIAMALMGAKAGMRNAGNPMPLATTQRIRPPANLNWNYPSGLSPIEEKILEYLRAKPDQSATDAELFRHLGIPTTPKLVKPEDEGEK